MLAIIICIPKLKKKSFYLRAPFPLIIYMYLFDGFYYYLFLTKKKREKKVIFHIKI